MPYQLRYYRVYQGYTQQQVADYLGVARSTYTLYELGKRQAPPSALAQLADFYHVSIDSLMGR